MSENKQYEKEYKVQAVKLAKKTGAANAAKELHAVRLDQKSKKRKS